MMRRPGFTLIELLVGVVIFSALTATLLSVISSMRRAEKFRDEQSVLPRSAHFALEPLARAVRESEVSERLQINGTCQTVRGFYGLRSTGNEVVIAPSPGNNQSVALVTLHREATPEALAPYQWVRKTYRSEPGSNGPQLIEQVAVIPPGTPQSWPAQIDRCSGQDLWQEVANRRKVLTDEETEVVTFALTMQAPLAEVAATRAPFVGIQLVLKNPRTGKQLGIQTTLTPGFSYGEVRNVSN